MMRKKQLPKWKSFGAQCCCPFAISGYPSQGRGGIFLTVFPKGGHPNDSNPLNRPYFVREAVIPFDSQEVCFVHDPGKPYLQTLVGSITSSFDTIAFLENTEWNTYYCGTKFAGFKEVFDSPNLVNGLSDGCFCRFRDNSETTIMVLLNDRNEYLVCTKDREILRYVAEENSGIFVHYGKDLAVIHEYNSTSFGWKLTAVGLDGILWSMDGNEFGSGSPYPVNVKLCGEFRTKTIICNEFRFLVKDANGSNVVDTRTLEGESLAYYRDASGITVQIVSRTGRRYTGYFLYAAGEYFSDDDLSQRVRRYALKNDGTVLYSGQVIETNAFDLKGPPSDLQYDTVRYATCKKKDTGNTVLLYEGETPYDMGLSGGVVSYFGGEYCVASGDGIGILFHKTRRLLEIPWANWSFSASYNLCAVQVGDVVSVFLDGQELFQKFSGNNSSVWVTTNTISKLSVVQILDYQNHTSKIFLLKNRDVIKTITGALYDTWYVYGPWFIFLPEDYSLPNAREIAYDSNGEFVADGFFWTGPEAEKRADDRWFTTPNRIVIENEPYLAPKYAQVIRILDSEFGMMKFDINFKRIA